MSKISFKVSITILTFIIGIIATAVWFIAPFSLIQPVEIAPPANIENEMTEEYAIYSVVINEYVIEDSRKLVISNQTSSYGDERHKAIYGDDYIKINTAKRRVRHMKENYPSVNEETLFDFDAKMIKSHKLYSNFNLSVIYNLTNEENYENDNFSAMLRLSKVGFNKEGNQAFVYTEFMCKVLCDRYDHLLLEKVDGRWRIKEIFKGLRS